MRITVVIIALVCLMVGIVLGMALKPQPTFAANSDLRDVICLTDDKFVVVGKNYMRLYIVDGETIRASNGTAVRD